MLVAHGKEGGILVLKALSEIKLYLPVGSRLDRSVGSLRRDSSQYVFQVLLLLDCEACPESS